jgi:hypothetical protein
MEQMLYHAEQEDVGAVGGMLLYPDNTVQHAGERSLRLPSVDLCLKVRARKMRIIWTPQAVSYIITIT